MRSTLRGGPFAGATPVSERVSSRNRNGLPPRSCSEATVAPSGSTPNESARRWRAASRLRALGEVASDELRGPV